MQIKSIVEVIQALNDIMVYCEQNKKRAGYFCALYKRMTVAVSEGIQKGMFEDGKRMEQLDIVFARRYLAAWEAYQKPATCSASWQYAFDGCLNDSLTVIQQLLLGINTHINLDLAIAAATIAPGAKISALKNDFHRINDVIAALVDDVQQCLEEVWFPMRLLKRIAAQKEQSVLNFSIGIARKTSWSNAVLLSGMNEAQQKKKINEMDCVVNEIGKRIIHPGLFSETILRAIRLTEYEDIARTIRLIDTTVVD